MINIEAQQDFWWFVNERHRIYLKKEVEQAPKPWTKDPILQEWKFCNVFRQLDKESKWLIDNVLHYKLHPEITLFNIFAFRAFNLHQTFQAILNPGTNFFLDWDKEKVHYDLFHHLVNNKLSSGAYMLRGREGIPKYESILLTLDEIWNRKEEVWADISKYNLMESTYNVLLRQKFWGWGPFTTYQVVLDLTYTPMWNNAPDINTWTVLGPGAIRGLNEIWPDIHKTNMQAACWHLLLDQVKYREPHVPALSLQDIEFCLCELQKYRRIKRGGKAKEKYDGR